MKHLPPISCFMLLICIANAFMSYNLHGGLGWMICAVFWFEKIQNFVILSKLEDTFS